MMNPTPRSRHRRSLTLRVRHPTGSLTLRVRCRTQRVGLQHSPRALLILLTMALPLTAAEPEASKKPVRLTVMTYNIHHAEGLDGKLDVPRIAEVIAAQKADIVGLQEIDRG